MSKNHAPRRLTEGHIRKLECNGRPFLVRDTAVRGFMVGVNRQTKTYKIQAELWTGARGKRRLERTIRRTLGDVEEMTLDDARAQAMKYLSQIKQGVDPWAKGSAAAESEAWTVGRMFDEYVADLRTRECAERTWQDVEKRVNRYLRDWKDIPMSAAVLEVLKTTE